MAVAVERRERTERNTFARAGVVIGGLTWVVLIVYFATVDTTAAGFIGLLMLAMIAAGILTSAVGVAVARSRGELSLAITALVLNLVLPTLAVLLVLAVAVLLNDLGGGGGGID